MHYPKHLGFQVFGALARLARAPLALVFISTPSFATVPSWMAEDLALYKSAKDAREYITKSKVIPRSDRSALLERTPAGTKLPDASISERPYLTLSVGRLKVELTNPEKRIITVNGQVLTIPPLTNTPALMALIAKHAPAKHASRWSPFPEAHADSDKILTGCLSDWQDFKFYMRSPVSAIMEYTWVTAQVHKLVAKASGKATKPTCDHQIAELKTLLAKNKVALKEISCDSEVGLGDRSMTFWLPEFTKGKKLKTREFDLDYARGLASEESVGKDPDEDEDEDEDESGTARASTVSLEDVEKEVKNTYRLYNFGTTALKEVNDIVSIDGENKCQPYDKTSPEFEKIKNEMEPFRQIFAFVENNGTCVVCAREVRAKLATKTPPKALRRLAITLSHQEATLHENSESQK